MQPVRRSSCGIPLGLSVRCLCRSGVVCLTFGSRGTNAEAPARSARLVYHQSSTGPGISFGSDLYLRTFYLMTSSSLTLSPPKSTRKRRLVRCSDSIRSLGFEKDHEWNVRWLEAARRVLKPDGTLWVSGMHHVIFSIGFALQSLGYRIINQIAWQKPDPSPTPCTPPSPTLTRRAVEQSGSSSGS